MTALSINIKYVCLIVVLMGSAKPTISSALSSVLIFFMESLVALPPSCGASGGDSLFLASLLLPTQSTRVSLPTSCCHGDVPPNLRLTRSSCGQNKSVFLVHWSHHLIFCMNLFCCLCSFLSVHSFVWCSRINTRHRDNGADEAQNYKPHFSNVCGWKSDFVFTETSCVGTFEIRFQLFIYMYKSP